MFHDMEGIKVIVDYLLIWGESEEEHDIHLIQVLERALYRNLMLNKTSAKPRRMLLHTLDTYSAKMAYPRKT